MTLKITDRHYQYIESEDFERYISERWNIRFSVARDEHVSFGSYLAYEDVRGNLDRFDRADLSNFQVGKLPVGSRFTHTLLKHAIVDGDLQPGNVLICITK
jgi:hypothetical protein